VLKAQARCVCVSDVWFFLMKVRKLTEARNFSFSAIRVCRCRCEKVEIECCDDIVMVCKTSVHGACVLLYVCVLIHNEENYSFPKVEIDVLTKKPPPIFASLEP